MYLCMYLCIYLSIIYQSSNLLSIIFFSFYLSIHLFSFPAFYLLQCFLFLGLIKFLLLANSSFTSENPFNLLQSPNPPDNVYVVDFFLPLDCTEEGTQLSERRWESPIVQLNGSWDQLSAILDFLSGYPVGLKWGNSAPFP